MPVPSELTTCLTTSRTSARTSQQRGSGAGDPVTINAHAHTEYMEAVEREDEKLERAIGSIVARTDAGELTTREAALERVAVLESHLEACQQHRRHYLGGS